MNSLSGRDRIFAVAVILRIDREAVPMDDRRFGHAVDERHANAMRPFAQRASARRSRDRPRSRRRRVPGPRRRATRRAVSPVPARGAAVPSIRHSPERTMARRSPSASCTDRRVPSVPPRGRPAAACRWRRQRAVRARGGAPAGLDLSGAVHGHLRRQPRRTPKLYATPTHTPNAVAGDRNASGPASAGAKVLSGPRK